MRRKTELTLSTINWATPWWWRASGRISILKFSHGNVRFVVDFVTFDVVIHSVSRLFTPISPSHPSRGAYDGAVTIPCRSFPSRCYGRLRLHINRRWHDGKWLFALIKPVVVGLVNLVVDNRRLHFGTFSRIPTSSSLCVGNDSWRLSWAIRQVNFMRGDLTSMHALAMFTTLAFRSAFRSLNSDASWATRWHYRISRDHDVVTSFWATNIPLATTMRYSLQFSSVLFPHFAAELRVRAAALRYGHQAEHTCRSCCAVRVSSSRQAASLATPFCYGDSSTWSHPVGRNA